MYLARAAFSLRQPRGPRQFHPPKGQPMTNLPPTQATPYGTDDEQPSQAQAQSGVPAGGVDPTNELGQTPSSLFGVALPNGTGAPGGPGAAPQPDPTLVDGQDYEGLSGLTPAQTADTGAPGSMGAQNGGAGGDRVTYTDPGSYLGGTFQSETVSDSVSGTDDWTQAIDGSYGAAKNLPGITGNMPTTTGAGQGRVMRGGRAVG